MFSVLSCLHGGIKGKKVKDDPMLQQHVEEIKQKYLPGYQSKNLTVSLAAKQREADEDAKRHNKVTLSHFFCFSLGN